MPNVVVAGIQQPAAWSALSAAFADANPGFRFDVVTVEDEVQVGGGGVEYFWPSRPGLRLEDGSTLDAGDLVTVAAGDRVTVTGAGWLWRITDVEPPEAVATGTVHLREVPDTSGGCAVDRDAFRRCALTWEGGRHSDGANRVNSHIVAITGPGSRTHYHPVHPPAGRPQVELYLVLDPKDWGLDLGDGPALLHAYPDLDELTQVQTVPLSPGDTVLIPPGTGHRGVDCLVNVVTLPGFKPGNELYLDDAIAAAGDRLPFNPKYAVDALGDAS